MTKISPIQVAADLHYDWHQYNFKNLTSPEAGNALKVLKKYANAYDLVEPVKYIAKLRKRLIKHELEMKLNTNIKPYRFGALRKLSITIVVDLIYMMLWEQEIKENK